MERAVSSSSFSSMETLPNDAEAQTGRLSAQGDEKDADPLFQVNLDTISFEDLKSQFLSCQNRARALQSQSDSSEKQLSNFLHENRTLRESLKEAKKREAELVNRLTQKEKDIHSLETTIKDLKESSNKKSLRMRTTFMDPLINENYRLLRNELSACKKQLQTAQDDMKATVFNPNSIIGHQLIAKCRKLQDENEEFGRKLSEGKTHQLQAELANQKVYTDELLKDLEDQRQFNEQLDEEVEQMQSTILKLKKELEELRAHHHRRDSRERGSGEEEEEYAARERDFDRDERPNDRAPDNSAGDSGFEFGPTNRERSRDYEIVEEQQDEGPSSPASRKREHPSELSELYTEQASKTDSEEPERKRSRQHTQAEDAPGHSAGSNGPESADTPIQED